MTKGRREMNFTTTRISTRALALAVSVYIYIYVCVRLHTHALVLSDSTAVGFQSADPEDPHSPSSIHQTHMRGGHAHTHTHTQSHTT